MTQTAPRHEITLKRVVYHLPGEDAVKIHRGIEYCATDLRPLTMDLYYPPDSPPVPNALSVLIQESPNALKCAVLCYGYTLDLDASTVVTDASKVFHFANPASGKTIEDLPANTPLFIARAGRDETPRLNEALDGFGIELAERRMRPSDDAGCHG